MPSKVGNMKLMSQRRHQSNQRAMVQIFHGTSALEVLQNRMLRRPCEIIDSFVLCLFGKKFSCISIRKLCVLIVCFDKLS